MADVKISALPASTTPLAGTEVLPIVQSSTTKQVSVANLTAGRAVSALSLTSTNGAEIQGMTVGLGGGAVAGNTAIGVSTLDVNSTGYSNTAVGDVALTSNVDGAENTAIGGGANVSNISGNANTSIGVNALAANENGSDNSALGRGAISSVSGSFNIGLGSSAGADLTTGNNNTFIGSYAGTAGLSDTVVISAGYTERLRIDSTGLLTLGGGRAVISTTDNTNAALRITQLGTGNALLVEDTTNPDSTPFVIDASGNVIVGYTALVATANEAGSAYTPANQIHGLVSQAKSSLALYNWIAGATNESNLTFSKSKSGAFGAFTVSASGDSLGAINFAGDDGAAFITAASIVAAVDGTPGTNDMPGRLVFSTTADGASSPTERMRINSAGIVTMAAYGVGTATFSATGVISSVSDETYKIKDGVIADPIPMIMALETGYYYGKPEANMGEGRQLGFYAQNVRAAIGPEAAPDPGTYTVTDKDGVETIMTKPWGYYDRSVLAVAIEAIKVQQAQITALTARIAVLESK